MVFKTANICSFGLFFFFFWVYFPGEEGASGDGVQEPTFVKNTYAKSVGCLVGEV